MAILWPYLLRPAFSLVDDGYSLTKGRTLITTSSFDEWQSTIVESHIGRFRPVYLLSFSLIYVLFGTHPIGLWFFQAIILWLILGLLFELMMLLHNRRWLATLLPLAWLYMPTVAENIFRVGPTEPRQVLLMLVALLFLFAFRRTKQLSHFVISLLFCVLAIGTKETSIMLLPIYGLVLAEAKIKKLTPGLVIILVGVGVGLLIVAVVLGLEYVFKSGYAVENFGLQLSDIKTRIFQSRINYAHYYFLLWLSLISLAVRATLALWAKSLLTFFRNNVASLIFLVLIIESIFFTLAWAFQFERYLFLTWTFVVLFLSIEIAGWMELLNKEKTLKNLSITKQGTLLAFVLITFILGLFVVFKGRGLDFHELMTKNIDIYRRSYDINQVEQAVIGELLANTTTTTLYTTNDNYEVIYELGLYLSQFGARPVTVISTNQDLAKNEAGYEFHPDPMTAFAADVSTTKLLVGRVADLQGADIPSNARLLQPIQRHDLIDPTQFWWYLEANP